MKGNQPAVDYKSMLYQVHALLHKGAISEAHDLCHRVCSGEDPTLQEQEEALHQERVANDMVGFDRGFRELCETNGVTGAYYCHVEVGTEGDMIKISQRMGGVAMICQFLERRLALANHAESIMRQMARG